MKGKVFRATNQNGRLFSFINFISMAQVFPMHVTALPNTITHTQPMFFLFDFSARIWIVCVCVSVYVCSKLIFCHELSQMVATLVSVKCVCLLEIGGWSRTAHQSPVMVATRRTYRVSGTIIVASAIGWPFQDWTLCWMARKKFFMQR